VLGSSGQPLSTSARASLEPKLGQNLGSVRIHDDDKAAALCRALNASAFAYGSNIYFAAGEHRADTPRGRYLLAHELTHVVQQNRPGAEARVQRFPAGPVPTPAPAQQTGGSPDTTPAAPDPGGKVDPNNLTASLPRLAAIAAKATARHQRATNFVSNGQRAVESISGSFEDVAKMYDEAYKRYASTMSAASAAAQLSATVKDAVIGVAIGVVVGFALPEVAAAKGIAKVLQNLKSNGIQAVLGLVVGKGVPLVSPPASFDVSFQLHPAVARLAQAKALISIYNDIVEISKATGPYHVTGMAAEKLIGDIRGSKSDKTPMDGVVEAIDELISFDSKGQETDSAIVLAEKSLARKESEIAADKAEATVSRLEQDIWIRHLDSLGRREVEALLDNNKIQTHLLTLGVIGPGSRTDTRLERTWVPFSNDLDSSVAKKASEATHTDVQMMDLAGQYGTASTDILTHYSAGESNIGLVNIDGRPWEAISGRGEAITRGDSVRVIGTQHFGFPGSQHIVVAVVKVQAL
jgi:hypothetical protein